MRCSTQEKNRKWKQIARVTFTKTCFLFVIFVRITLSSLPYSHAYQSCHLDSFLCLFIIMPQDAGRAPASSPGAASGAAGTTAGLLHHQWLEVDFGAHTPERWVLPTALLLVCDNQNAPLYDMESTPVNGSSSTNINEHYSHGELK